MKKLLWTSAMALTAAACMTACDDSSSGASNSIPEFKTEAALPDTCEMEVAKVDTAYFACFENKWIEVTDSATVEQLKEGLDEDEIKAKLEELEDQLKPATPAKPKSSSSKNTDEDVESSDSEEPESSSSEECTGRRCKTGNSSSSKKSSGGNGGSGSGDSGEGGSGEGGDSSPSSTDSSDDSSPSSTDSSGDSSPSSATSGTSTESKCGTETYDPSTQWCRTADNTVIAIANTSCCGSGSKCGYTDYATSPKMFYDVTKEFCDSRTGANYRIYKYVNIGTQTWMAENLNYETASGSYCYNDDPDNCDTYGRLYDWDIAVSTTSPVCPTGWRIPSLQEYKDLIVYVDNLAEYTENNTAGNKLKATTGWDGFAGDGSYEFNLMPAGYYNNTKKEYGKVGSVAMVLASDDKYSYLLTNNSYTWAYAYEYTTVAARSVRCIKDTAGED